MLARMLSTNIRRVARPSLAGCFALAVLACAEPAAAPAPANPAGPALPPGTAPAGDSQIPGAPQSPQSPQLATGDDGPTAKLRAGVWRPVAMDAVTGTITSTLAGDEDYYALEFAMPRGDGRTLMRAAVDDAGSDALVVTRTDGDVLRVWLRRPTPSKMLSTSFSGTLWFLGYEAGNQRWYAAPFTATGTPTKDTALAGQFAEALSTQLLDGSSTPTTPFHHFAAGRIHAALLGKAAASSPARADARARMTTTDLSQLMYTTTAATSLQEALQYEKGLGITSNDGPRDIALSTLAAPALADHPFEAMRAGLTVTAATPTTISGEPLAAAVPAEFWYVRFSDIRDMLRVLDEASTWITPVAHAMEERPLVRDLAERYQRELGLGRSGLAKALGHTAVSRLAITGSDPYLRDGSDVSFIFEVASQAIFDTELARHLADWQAKVDGVTRTEVLHNGHVIAIHVDPLGLVRQHRAQVGNLAVVSNSEAACKRVLDAIDGTKPRLSDEPDLRYMLARDPGEHDAFAFIGDRFVSQVVGPQQKIQQARRMQALADLSTPGHAALLYGWLNGRAPASTDEMLSANVLTAAELRHGDGTPIAFAPGAAARSSWGRADGLRPRIDLPDVDKVSAAERDAYANFSREYQDYWRQFIDPIAVRIDLDDDGDAASIDVRVLPLIEGTNYRDVEQVVGAQHVVVPAIDDGLQAVWGVGKDTELRRDLDRLSTSFSGKADLGLGWLGEWVMVGTLDRAGLSESMAVFDARVQVPLDDALRGGGDDALIAAALGKLPVFAAADINSTAGLVAALAALRALVNDVAPGNVTWENFATHREIAIVRVGIASSAPEDMRKFADSIAIYYAQAGGAIVFALQQRTLETLIDRLLDEKLRPTAADSGASQFVIEGHVRSGGGAWTALLWALQGQAQVGQASARRYAEAIVRGDPSTATDAAKFRALSLAYFGGVPVTSEGRTDYSLVAEGVTDPLHGSEITPAFPELPIAGTTPIGALMMRLSSMRASVSFDDEPTSVKPPVRSLHTRFELTLGAAEG